MKKITLAVLMAFISFCGYAQYPEGFEGTWTTQTGTGAGGPSGWAIANVSGPINPWIQGNGSSQQPAYAGTKSAFMASENVASNTQAEDWLITPLTTVPANGQLRFWSHLFVLGDQQTDYLIKISTVTTGTNPQWTTGNFTTLVQWDELTINPQQQEWTEKVVSLSAYAGQQVYIAFVMMTDAGDRWAIDNVNVVSQCQDPTALGANTIGMTTANFTWTNPGGATQFELEVVPQAAAPTGVGTSIAATTSYAVTGLTADTCYKYYLRAICSPGNPSNWVGPFNFCTGGPGDNCASAIPVSALPFSVTDNTSNNADTVEGSPGATGCGTTSPYLSGNDVFYSYTAPANGTISIDVSNHGTWAGVFVYTSCANVGVSCVGGVSNSSATAALTIPSLAVTAGTTYYIVISTWATPQTTPYTLTIQAVNCAPPVGQATTTTATSANLSWTNPSTATSWQLVVQSPGAGIPTGAGTTVTSNTNLPVSATTPANIAFTSATAYEYYVRADCGNGTFSAWAGPYSFMTTQVPAPMPVAENWDTGTTNGWSLSNGTEPNKWFVGTATFNSPGHSLYISNDNGVTNNYNITQNSVVHAFRDVTIPAGTGQINFGFDWKNLGETGWDYIRVWIVPTSYMPVTGTQITAAADRVQVGGNFVGSSTWTTSNNILNVGAYAGQTRRFIFEWRNDTSGGVAPPGAIDNINISAITCSQPPTVTLGTATETQATFNWTAPTTPPASYDYYFSTTSTAPTAATVPTGNTTALTRTETGLTPSTTYYFWVRSHCSDSDQSFWTGPVSFTTPQVPAPLPIAEAWTTGTTNGWTLSNGTQPNKWFVGTATFNSPGHSLYVTNDNGVTNNYTNNASSVVHAYRDVTVPAGTTDINFGFDWKNVGETGFDYIRVWIVPATWTPVPGTQVTAAVDRIQVGANFVGSNTWTTYNAVLNAAPYANSIRRVIFEWRNDGIIGTNPAGAVDNINISVITCPQPTALTATATDIEATLGWTSPGPATQWEYYIAETPATAPTPTTVGTLTTDSTPTIVVEPATQYQYWVRSVCGPADKSFWSGPFTFNSTICQPAQQCNYNFILTDSWGDGWNGNTMTVSQNGIPVATFGSTFTTGVGPVTISVPLCNNLPFQLYWNTGGNFANEVGVSVVNGFNQTLYSKPAGTGTQNSLLYTGEVDCLNPACLPPSGVTITDESTTTTTLQWTPSPVVGATYEVYYTTGGNPAPGETPPATNVVATTTPSAIVTGLLPSTIYDFYVRTICSATSNSIWAGPYQHETDPLCPEPLDLTLSCLSSTGASIAWTPDGDETSWEVVVQPASAPIPTTGTVVTVPEYLAEDLTPGTAYTFYVRAVCAGVLGYSSWATLNFTTTVGPGDAEALCASSLSVPNSTGVTGYGSIGCLGSTPNPIWYYLTVDYDGTIPTGGTMNFTLQQTNTNGTPIDVDFAAFGPFTSALDACSQIELAPGANPLIVACSYSASATEIFTIPNAQDGQVYALLLTNFNGQAGNITLTQTNATAPNAPVTSCDPVVELGNNQLHCATESTEVTANVDNPAEGDEFAYVWTIDGAVFTPTIVETGDDFQTIEVDEPGEHVIGVTITVTDNPGQPTAEDLVVITLSPAFTVPAYAEVVLCGATGTADLDFSTLDLLGDLDAADYEVTGVYTSAANAASGTAAIDTSVPYNTGTTTLYVAIGDVAVPDCFQVAPLSIVVNTTPDADISYADAPFCSTETTGTVTQTGSAGGTYTSTTGLTIDPATGAIDIATSTPGTYTVTYTIAAAASCPEFVTTVDVLIEEAPEATIAYAASPYCSDGTTAAVTLTGTQGGTFTADSADLSIDAATGEINLATSTAGTYTVTYTVADTANCTGIAVTTEVTITELPVAAIDYAGSPYCSDAGVATVTFTGDAGGVYTATDGLIIDAVTGEIDLDANASGTYTVTYTIAAANGCGVVSTTDDITITDLPVADFSYTYATVCQNAEAQSITLGAGAIVGTFSADATGLALDTATGTITPGSSDAGTYVVTNTIAAANGCGDVTHTFTITVTPAPVPTFAYAAPAYCQDGANPVPVLTGVSGTFTADSGLAINPATGEINVANSTPGTYEVLNTIVGTPDCPTVTYSTEVTITSLPVLQVSQGCEDNFYIIAVDFNNDDIYTEDTVSIEWTNPAGQVIGTTAAVDITGDEFGTYTVEVTPLDGAVCPAVGTLVVDRTTCFTPRGISPNGDTLNDTFDLSGLNVTKLLIFNRYGTEVYSFNGAYTDQFAGVASNGENLPSGTYFYMFERANGLTETGWVYVNFEEN